MLWGYAVENQSSESRGVEDVMKDKERAREIKTRTKNILTQSVKIMPEIPCQVLLNDSNITMKDVAEIEESFKFYYADLLIPFVSLGALLNVVHLVLGSISFYLKKVPQKRYVLSLLRSFLNAFQAIFFMYDYASFSLQPDKVEMRGVLMISVFFATATSAIELLYLSITLQFYLALARPLLFRQMTVRTSIYLALAGLVRMSAIFGVAFGLAAAAKKTDVAFKVTIMAFTDLLVLSIVNYALWFKTLQALQRKASSGTSAVARIDKRKFFLFFLQQNIAMICSGFIAAAFAIMLKMTTTFGSIDLATQTAACMFQRYPAQFQASTRLCAILYGCHFVRLYTDPVFDFALDKGLRLSFFRSR